MNYFDITMTILSYALMAYSGYAFGRAEHHSWMQKSWEKCQDHLEYLILTRDVTEWKEKHLDVVTKVFNRPYPNRADKAKDKVDA